MRISFGKLGLQELLHRNCYNEPYFLGKRFCIRGGDEQRGLGPSQFRRSSDPDCYTYVEHGSKNRVGGVAELRIENKVVPCYSVPENGEKCLVSLLDTYLNKLPGFAFDKDILYCRPNQLYLFEAHGTIRWLLVQILCQVWSEPCALMLELLPALTILCVLPVLLPYFRTAKRRIETIVLLLIGQDYCNMYLLNVIVFFCDNNIHCVNHSTY